MSKPKVSRTVVSVLMYVTAVAFPSAAQSPPPDPKNFEKTKAQAEAGDVVAEFNLADCYMSGKVVPHDAVEACKWLRKAAEQNYVKAQVVLGICYYGGEGVQKNVVEAYKWMALAAAQGYQAGKNGLKEIESELTPAQKAEGEKLVREFKPVAPTARQESSATTTPTASPQ